MDYQNRAGSKKGSGGIASASQENLHRRKQVEELLRDGEEVPYSFQGVSKEDEELSKKNPYIYKNHAGRLVCKLCNTIHMSWSSVGRHLEGKKHGLNLLRRGGGSSINQQEGLSQEETEFKQQVEQLRSQIKDNDVLPDYQVAKIQDPTSGSRGIAMKFQYPKEKSTLDKEDRPFVRIMSSLELSSDDNEDKKYVIVAFEPFKTVAIEIPNRDLQMIDFNTSKEPFVDDFNGKFTYWDCDELTLYVQIFFND
ncbi:LAME_0F05688g1_1 [Lachancea meyersii CBS 8951]|uniref:LAME_0F05688g1_1 n=1 Tax=Lachancea meyersii CBS 8951 TaxID=1266667 RepID=A0A1G4JSX1_9SACH|nr:LAME_0F05688g1_1 [Lachancea meyersii CBS 8951]